MKGHLSCTWGHFLRDINDRFISILISVERSGIIYELIYRGRGSKQGKPMPAGTRKTYI